jgi:hypothetical protein
MTPCPDTFRGCHPRKASTREPFFLAPNSDTLATGLESMRRRAREPRALFGGQARTTRQLDAAAGRGAARRAACPRRADLGRGMHAPFFKGLGHATPELVFASGRATWRGAPDSLLTWKLPSTEVIRCERMSQKSVEKLDEDAPGHPEWEVAPPVFVSGGCPLLLEAGRAPHHANVRAQRNAKAAKRHSVKAALCSLRQRRRPTLLLSVPSSRDGAPSAPPGPTH